MLVPMRKLLLAVAAVAALAAFPRSASAGFLLEGSVAMAAQTSPSVERAPVNVMLAPGWGFAGMLKLELGLVGGLTDLQNSKFDLELRPMLVVAPPFVPLYLRAIFAVQNLINGPTTYAYGGALGLSFSLFGAGLFVEAGVLPRNVTVDVATNVPVVGTPTGATREEFRWFAEGRVGAAYEF